jgi:mannose-1-phosphate guanylyltransferase
MNRVCAPFHERAAVILAGGDGTRLRPLTRRIAGEGVPKQFCPVIGSKTLCEQTYGRCALSVAPEATVVALTCTHERCYRPLLARVPPGNLVIQPENRGTAPAILYSLVRLAARAPSASVVILPSDHYVSDDREFMRHIERAFAAVETRPELTALLGIAPDAPESGYGWIEPGELVLRHTPIFRVERFVEKPGPDVARQLMRSGSLWNSFVMVARISTLLALIRIALPDLFAHFFEIRGAFGTGAESRRIEKLYARIAPADFSREVLARHPINLGVLPVHGVQWSDLGEPQRVIDVLASLGIHPQWEAA